MLRARTVGLLLMLLLVPVGGWAGAGYATVNGAYTVRFNLNTAPTLPAGATVTCKARIAPNSAGLENLNGQPAAPVETATGVARVRGSTAVCAVEIPFSWTVNHAQSGVLLSYEIEAVSRTGSAPLVVRRSALQGIAVVYPPPGGTAGLTVGVTF